MAVVESYTFRVWDYVVVIGVLLLTALIGLYHVWRAKITKNTREFLVANRSIGLTPLVLSMTATSLTPGSLLGLPMEAYSNGIQLLFACVAGILSKWFAVYAIVPVVYNLNVNTLNQYIEMRFNRTLRTVPASIGMLQNSIVIAAITYITALVLSKATDLSVWSCIVLIMGICIVYSSLGGVAAVIWTDVLQILVIFVTFAVMLVAGIMSTGGIGNAWEQNRLGDRTTFAYWKPEAHSHYTIWSLFLGYFFLTLGHSITSQSELQRQLANRTLSGAQKMSMSTTLVLTATSFSATFIGMLVYAKYRNCDPLLKGDVTSRDQLAAIFAMETFINFPGLFGLYVAGILCATLSTLSSVINAFATITLIDFIKPFMPTAPDATSKRISKGIGFIYGLLIMSLTGITQYFGGLTQTMQAIGGTSVGPTGGLFFLGVFFPWANSKGATVGYFTALIVGWWLSIGRILAGAPFTTAPLSTIDCPNKTENNFENFQNQNYTMSEFVHFEMAPSVSPLKDETFFFFAIIPIWYSLITMTIVIVIGMIVSYLTGFEDLRNLDPNLISPLTKRLARSLPESIQKKSGLMMLLANDRKLAMILTQDIKNGNGSELQNLNPKSTQTNVNNANGVH